MKLNAEIEKPKKLESPRLFSYFYDDGDTVDLQEPELASPDSRKHSNNSRDPDFRSPVLGMPAPYDPKFDQQLNFDTDTGKYFIHKAVRIPAVADLKQRYSSLHEVSKTREQLAMQSLDNVPQIPNERNSGLKTTETLLTPIIVGKS